jgi:hypothetical protein
MLKPRGLTCTASVNRPIRAKSANSFGFLLAAIHVSGSVKESFSARGGEYAIRRHGIAALMAVCTLVIIIKIDRNQRESQRVEPAQQALQSSLIHVAG